MFCLQLALGLALRLIACQLLRFGAGVQKARHFGNAAGQHIDSVDSKHFMGIKSLDVLGIGHETPLLKYVSMVVV